MGMAFRYGPLHVQYLPFAFVKVNKMLSEAEKEHISFLSIKK